MSDKLSTREITRLKEIRARAFINCGISPATTKLLISKGLCVEKGGMRAKTGRVIWHGDAHLTDAGRALLDEQESPAL